MKDEHKKELIQDCIDYGFIILVMIIAIVICLILK